MSQAVPDIATQLAALRKEFRDSLPERLARLEHDLAALNDRWEASCLPALTGLRANAHRLAGAAGTFGMGALGEVAHDLEILAQQLMTHPEHRDPAALARLRALSESLAELAADSSPTEQASGNLASTVALERSGGKSIFIVDDDPAGGRDIAEKIARHGYSATVFTSPEAMLAALAEQPPAALVLNQTLPGGMLDLGLVAQARSALKQALPVLVVSARGDLDARLHALREGCNAYLTKPADPGTLIDHLDALLLRSDPVPWRVLLVEDDEIFARACRTVLAAAGIEVDWLSDPAELLTRIGELRPDLIILDMYLPGCRGDELAAVIRQFDAWQGIPLIFLSAEQDRDRQITALEAGGDDFLSKPIAPEELRRLVIARIRRTQRLRAMMSRDSLTGLLNHVRFIEQLGIELARAVRNGQPLAMAMIDIDHFKQVNDSHGHATGDIVIRSLARLLKQRLRQVDVIGRYGGEEFAVVLPDTPLPAAIAVLDEIRQTFNAQRFLRSGTMDATNTFQVSFSAGVSAWSAKSEAAPRPLIEAADRALYRAKHAGRDRIIGNPPETPQ